MADSLTRTKHYSAALLEYERVYFELTELPDTTRSEDYLQTAQNACLLQKVYCLKQMGDFEEAHSNALRFDLRNLPDTVHTVLRTEIMVCCYLAKLYEDALVQVQQLRFFVKDSTLHSAADLWEILALMQLKRYAEAKTSFIKYKTSKNLAVDAEQVFAFIKKPRFRDAKKAKILATFLPGAGMVYAGNPKEGVISLLLQATSLGFAGVSIYNGYYLSGFFTGFGLFQAFYFGGIKRTESLVEKRNLELVKTYTQSVTKALTKR
ncbi:MAG: hypothetical protein EAZ70_09760 [Runella slithyformis]|nr:MAG: hypothetical protein EAY79_07625 [Runella slithyformis]TAE93862.1 MAG: hypothetical protein EAZ80_10965 [Runella slithyformis]TAF25639.1 MAG: hypothetical protein EAZ70_09760 [Runella slithyformis]TAF43984.1 MAG: hypothetical protein EAZ63_12875 [Runella slithyformis]TAF79922.1 MAG: hypothetical protein EAZ50_10020 [Runella slithyformis]